MDHGRVAIVTGALKGLGLESAKGLLTKGYQVIIAGRDAERGIAVETELKGHGSATFIMLDVADVASIKKFTQTVLEKYQTVDVLINNAGIFPDRDHPGDAGELAELMQKGFATNAVGPFLLAEAFLPIMMNKGYGRIVNVSSGMGQLSAMGSGSPAYRLSKVALNGVTKFFATSTKGTDVLVNSVCPGWVKTDMGGADAPRSLEKGASGIVWAATLPAGGPNGGFFRDGKSIEF